MPVRRERGTGTKERPNGKYFFRFMIDGVSVSGIPGSTGRYQHLKNSAKGASEAESIAREDLRKVGPTGKKEVPTLRHFVDTFYTDKMRTIGNADGVNKQSVLATKGSHLRCHIFPTVGNVKLDAINSIVIEDFKIALAKLKLAPKTINNILGTLNNILTNAKQRAHIAAIPEFEWCRVPLQDFDFLDFGEAERLIAAAAHDSEWSAAIVLAIKTGMRLGELRALRWESIDFAKSQVTVCRSLWKSKHEGTPKNGKNRTIDLTASAVAALKAHRHLRGARVFLRLDGKDYSEADWYAALRRAYKRAGLREIGWHCLRHTLASHLVMRGETLKVVSEILGHATITMTNRYAHLAPGATRTAVAKLDEPAPFAEILPRLG